MEEPQRKGWGLESLQCGKRERPRGAGPCCGPRCGPAELRHTLDPSEVGAGAMVSPGRCVNHLAPADRREAVTGVVYSSEAGNESKLDI